MSFIELRECDIISTVYTTYPNYILSMSLQSDIAESDFFYIFSSSEGKTRDYFNVDDEPVTGSSFILSGSAKFYRATKLSSNEKRVLERLKNIYFSNSFEKPYNYSSSSIYTAPLYNTNDFYILNLPSVLYGTEIKPFSFKLEFASDGHIFTDDGKGGLYSGSILVGSVFYQHGIIYLFKNVAYADQPITASFSGTNKIPINMYNCKVPRGELNYTTNPSYVQFTSSTNRNEITTKDPKTFITAIGLYDENYNLVGIAKVSNPILNEEATGILFRLKLNF